MAATESKIPASDGGNVTVSSDETTVSVRWTCGGQYVFTKDGARAALENFERVNLVPDLIWKDAAGRREYYAKLVGKQFLANDNIFETATGVPWDTFRAAFVKAIGPAKKTTAKRAPAKKRAKKPPL